MGGRDPHRGWQEGGFSCSERTAVAPFIRSDGVQVTNTFATLTQQSHFWQRSYIETTRNRQRRSLESCPQPAATLNAACAHAPLWACPNEFSGIRVMACWGCGNGCCVLNQGKDHNERGTIAVAGRNTHTPLHSSPHPKPWGLGRGYALRLPSRDLAD